jgi:hypothetical protein
MEAVLSALAVITFLSVTTYAADPNAPQSKKAKPPTVMKLPSSKPVSPANRTPSRLTREMSFGQAMDILRNSTSPPLNIVVLWRQIGENAGVYRETPIGIDGVPGLRVGQCLELILLSLSAGASANLGYVVNNGVITVGTTDALPAPRKVTRVYDISDLTAEPARYFFPPMGFGGVGYGGGPMMGPAGYAPGASYMAAGPGRSYGDQGISNVIGSLTRSTRRQGTYRRR